MSSQYAYQLTMKFIRNLVNLLKISPYQIRFKKLVFIVFVKVLKMKKKLNIPINILFQKYLTPMLQHHQHLQNFTDQLHVHISAKPISAPTDKHHIFKNPLKNKRQ